MCKGYTELIKVLLVKGNGLSLGIQKAKRTYFYGIGIVNTELFLEG